MMVREMMIMMHCNGVLQSSKRLAGKLVHDGGGADDDAGDDEEEEVVQENLGSPILQEVRWW